MDTNLVNLSANYYELVIQDKINFSMQVEAKEKTKEATLKNLKKKVKEVQEIFRKKKLVAQLSYQTVNEENEYNGDKIQKTGFYIGTAQLQIIAYDFDLVNNIVDELVESNKAIVGQIITSISEKTKQSKEEEFTNQAIAAFQAKAKNIAKSFGANAYTLVNVSVNSAEDEYGNRRNSMMMASASSISGTLPSSMGQDQDSSYISPRESKIAVTIQGSIQLIQ